MIEPQMSKQSWEIQPARPASTGVTLHGINLEDDLITAFLLTKHQSENTRLSYRNALRRFATHRFGNKNLSEVTISSDMAGQVSSIDITAYLGVLKARGFKPSSIRHARAVLSKFFKWLTAQEIIDRNPADPELIGTIKMSRGDQSIKYLSQEEAEKLVRVASENKRTGIRDRALILTLINMVLRRSEVASMNVEDISEIDGYKVLSLLHTKSGDLQTVKMPLFIFNEIQRMRDNYGIESGALWRNLSFNGTGERMSDRSIYNVVNRTAEKAGLGSIGVHTLRHTGCTLALNNGATLKQVQDHARHAKIETTMIYIHNNKHLEDNAADYVKIFG